VCHSSGSSPWRAIPFPCAPLGSVFLATIAKHKPKRLGLIPAACATVSTTIHNKFLPFTSILFPPPPRLLARGTKSHVLDWNCRPPFRTVPGEPSTTAGVTAPGQMFWGGRAPPISGGRKFSHRMPDWPSQAGKLDSCPHRPVIYSWMARGRPARPAGGRSHRAARQRNEAPGSAFVCAALPVEPVYLTVRTGPMVSAGPERHPTEDPFPPAGTPGKPMAKARGNFFLD